MTLALVAGLGNMNTAEAGIKIRATVTTPNVHVRVGTTPLSHYRSYTRRHVYVPPTCEVVYYRTNPRDRAIALRLSDYTGVAPRELIGLKRQGYTWVEIGAWIDVPRYVVRAARHERTWRKFLRKQRKAVRRTIRGQKHPWNKAAFGDGDDIYDG